MSSSPSPTASPGANSTTPPPPSPGTNLTATPPPPGTNLTATPPPPPSPPIPVSTLFSPPPPPTSTNTNITPPFVQPPSHGGLPPGAVAGLVVGIGLGAIMVLVAVGIFVFFYRKKKRKQPQLLSGGEQGSKDNFTTAPPQHWQHNTPSTGNKVTLLPMPSPPPGIVVAQWSPALGTTLNESSSGSLGSEKPFPLPSPGLLQGTFSLEELVRATDGFSDANLLGQGGFGYVHKGVLSDGKVVAVKQLKAGSGQGEREFRAEIEIISRVHHRHLVSLFGYCITGAQRLLVYDFVPNKTLEFHLHGKGRPTMGWSTRMKIAIGSAKGLGYLHQDCHPKIIHRDIKAANILLDNGFEAKVADFGLAKYSLDTDTHVSTRVVGTFGYMAPEYASTGKLTDKSDVFSFGVVLLELITGRRPVDRTQPFADESIVDWARPLLTKALEDGNYDALVDPNLEEYDSTEMAGMISCAAACVRHSARFRPQMSQIVRALEGNMSLDDLSDGITPGYSVVYSSTGSSDYGSSQYKEDMKKFRKIALESQELVSSEYSGPTSDQHPSSSSTECLRTTLDTDSQATDKTIKDSHDSS